MQESEEVTDVNENSEKNERTIEEELEPMGGTEQGHSERREYVVERIEEVVVDEDGELVAEALVFELVAPLNNVFEWLT